MTAVEWLIKELSSVLGPIKTEVMQDLFIVDIIEEAKQMEKEQIMDACEYVIFNGLPRKAEGYYNETYNK